MSNVISLEQRLQKVPSFDYFLPLDQENALQLISRYEGFNSFYDFSREILSKLLKYLHFLNEHDCLNKNFLFVKPEFSWSDERESDLSQSQIKIECPDRAIFDFYEENYYMSPEDTVESLYDHIIRSFITHHNRSQRHKCEMTYSPLIEVKKRAMRENDQFILSRINHLPRITKFSRENPLGFETFD